MGTCGNHWPRRHGESKTSSCGTSSMRQARCQAIAVSANSHTILNVLLFPTHRGEFAQVKIPPHVTHGTHDCPVPKSPSFHTVSRPGLHTHGAAVGMSLGAWTATARAGAWNLLRGPAANSQSCRRQQGLLLGHTRRFPRTPGSSSPEPQGGEKSCVYTMEKPTPTNHVGEMGELVLFLEGRLQP